jgi:aryl-alcohol dehydrogenase-like predicted oxidoreductase
LPPWHKATPEVRRVARKAAEYAASRGVDIAQLAVQFSIQNEAFATCIVGSADPQNVRKWAHWAESPPDEELIRDVRQILEPIRDWFYIEGLPENNDSASE